MDSDRDTGTQDSIQGTGSEVKGRAEQTLGGITGNREQQGQGMVDEAKGNIQHGIGDLKDNLSDNDNRS